jgi:hypothetical protein
MKKYGKQDQISLAIWAADCAQRVLPFFAKAYPKDKRPLKALETCRRWARTGVFRMADIRGASLAAHAAARKAKTNEPACFAARAAGQAVATAHVPQHAFGASYYALKAIAASDPTDEKGKISGEWKWQLSRITRTLRKEVLKRVIIQKHGSGIVVKIQKGRDF